MDAEDAEATEPDGDWFDWWVAIYVKATGSGAEVKDLLVENCNVILRGWGASRDELDECADRLVREGRVPRFPNEHTNALHRELRALREERSREGRPEPATLGCPACGGSGLAVIPVRACVLDGMVILHPELGRIVTGAVICDREGCEAGERVQFAERARKDDKPRRPRLSRCERACGRRDLPEMLRESEREAAATARKAHGAGPLLPNLAAALAAGGIRSAA